PTLELPPVPALPAPAVDLGAVPLPPFLTGVAKPLPPVRDPGRFKCAFATFRGAESLVDCGVHRLFEQDLGGARAAFEESLATEPRGPQAPAAHAWLGEIGLLERNVEAAERHYQAALGQAAPGRAALGPGLVPELRAHAELGLGLVALRKGDPTEA